MTVIAMTREMGTLGKDVAFGLSEKLKLEIIHHELIESEIAEQMNLQESAVHRYLEGNPSLLERWKIDPNRLSRYTAAELLEVANKGNIIIRGWGAAQLLYGVKHVLCVRICAPMEFRITNMMHRLGISDRSTVRREIERSDAAHTRVMHNMFSGAWEDPINYHIVLNTGCVPVETCIEQVRALAKNPAFKETPESRSMLTDKMIETQVRALLVTSEAQFLDVDVKAGHVSVSGVVSHKQDVKSVIDKIRNLDGVNAVDANLASLDNIYAG